MVLLSAQAMDVAMIAQVTFTSPDRVRDVLTTSTWTGSTRCIHAMPAAARRPSPWPSGARSSRPRCPARSTTICPSELGAWAKLAYFLVAEGVVDDISHEGLRLLLREEGVSFQVIKTWKTRATIPTSRLRRTASCTCMG